MPGHGALASMITWLDHALAVLVKFWRPQHSLLGAQARWQHPSSRHNQARWQQLAVGGVLTIFVLALLYFDSGSSRRRDTAAVVSPVASHVAEGKLPLRNHASKSAVDEPEALCRALSRMQVCSHRSSVGPTDKGNDAPFLERMELLAATGIVCYDIDATITADGKLVVGYPFHIVNELRAAGRSVQPGLLETVPWSEYVAAGLNKRHPQLQDVLAVFATILKGPDSQATASEQSAAGGAAAGDGVGDRAVTAAGVEKGGTKDVGQTGPESVASTDAQQAGGQDGSKTAAEVKAEGRAGGKEVKQEVSQIVDKDERSAEKDREDKGHDGDLPAKQEEQEQQRQQTRPDREEPKTQNQAHDQQQQEQQQQRPEQKQKQPEQKPQKQQQAKGRRLLVLQEQGGGNAAQQQEHQAKGWAQPTALLLIELKDSAMRPAAAEMVHNLTHALGIQSRVGLWFPRAGADGPAAAANQAVAEHLHRLDSGLQRVLGLPDTRRMPDGNRVPLSIQLQPSDVAEYDFFGPSVKHSDAALSEVVKTAAPKPVVAWVVDSLDEATRCARAGLGLLVANDPMALRNRLQAAARHCGAGLGGATSASSAADASAAGGETSGSGATATAGSE